ncbi:MAG: DUF948 domain-containing protein [Candidatus Gracilibacteria bacterium]|jgi:predicted PurR-regulated permease PerM
MDPLAFLYIALGVGFLLLVIFICVTLIYFMQILRDVNKITDSARDTAERVNDYVLQPLALISQVVEHVKPMIDAIQQKRHQLEDNVSKIVQKSASKFKNKK